MKTREEIDLELQAAYRRGPYRVLTAIAGYLADHEARLPAGFGRDDEPMENETPTLGGEDCSNADFRGRLLWLRNVLKSEFGFRGWPAQPPRGEEYAIEMLRRYKADLGAVKTQPPEPSPQEALHAFTMEEADEVISDMGPRPPASPQEAQPAPTDDRCPVCGEGYEPMASAEGACYRCNRVTKHAQPPTREPRMRRLEALLPHIFPGNLGTYIDAGSAMEAARADAADLLAEAQLKDRETAP